MIDITDSLPLPPFAFNSSPSYGYRKNHLNFSSAGIATTPAIGTAIDDGIDRCLKSFNETCRTLSLIVALSTREAAAATSSMEETHRQSSSASFSQSAAPPFTDSQSTGVWSLFIAQWLVQISDQHAGSPETIDGAATTQGSKSVPRNSFLSIVHAIVALHRLSPFDSPSLMGAIHRSRLDGMMIEGNQVRLDAAGFRLAIRAMELMVRGVREKVRDALKRGGGKEDGMIHATLANNGVLKLVGECKAFLFFSFCIFRLLTFCSFSSIGLPHCFKLLGVMSELANRDAETYALVCDRQLEITRLSADLNALRSCGLGSNVSPTNTRSNPDEFEGFGLLPRRSKSELERAEQSKGFSAVTAYKAGPPPPSIGGVESGVDYSRYRGPSSGSISSSNGGLSNTSSPLFSQTDRSSFSTINSLTPHDSKDGWNPYTQSLHSPQHAPLPVPGTQQQQRQHQHRLQQQHTLDQQVSAAFYAQQSSPTTTSVPADSRYSNYQFDSLLAQSFPFLEDKTQQDTVMVDARSNMRGEEYGQGGSKTGLIIQSREVAPGGHQIHQSSSHPAPPSSLPVQIPPPSVQHHLQATQQQQQLQLNPHHPPQSSHSQCHASAASIAIPNAPITLNRQQNDTPINSHYQSVPQSHQRPPLRRQSHTNRMKSAHARTSRRSEGVNGGYADTDEYSSITATEFLTGNSGSSAIYAFPERKKERFNRSSLFALDFLSLTRMLTGSTFGETAQYNASISPIASAFEEDSTTSDYINCSSQSLPSPSLAEFFAPPIPVCQTAHQSHRHTQPLAQLEDFSTSIYTYQPSQPLSANPLFASNPTAEQNFASRTVPRQMNAQYPVQDNLQQYFTAPPPSLTPSHSTAAQENWNSG